MARVTAVPGSAGAKSGPTYFTPERLEPARRNVERYEWAKGQERKILSEGDPIHYYTGEGKYTSADDFAALSDDAMWSLMSETTIPRVYPHERRALCPLHGEEVRAHSVWCPWQIDPIHHPLDRSQPNPLCRDFIGGTRPNAFVVDLVAGR